MKYLILFLMALTINTHSFAAELKANTFRLGAMAGNVGLLDDVGDDAGNALGFGGIAGYSLSDEFHLELTYLQSSHDDLDHSEFAVGVMNYFEAYESMYFNGAAGIAFATNEKDATILTPQIKDSAFGLYLGGGADVITKQNWIFGLQARYYMMFDASKDVAGTEVDVVQDFFTVLFRVMYNF